MSPVTTPLREVPGDGRHAAWTEPMLLLAAGLFLMRLVYLPWINLFPEEAYYWNYAQHLDLGYLDHPPMVAWLIAAGTRLGGQTEFGVRCFALVCSVATTFFSYRLAALLYGRRAGAAAALLVQGLPFFFMAGWIMTPDAPLTACWAGMLYALASVFFGGSARAWLGVGVCLGLGVLSKYTIVLLGPATLLFMVLDRPSRGWFRHWAPYAAVGLAAVIFSPVVGWNATHHWASFSFQSAGRLRQPRRFSLPELLGSVLLMLTPVGIWLAARTWQRTAAATLGVMAEEKRRRLFAWVFTLTPLAVFVVFSLTHRVKLNWTGPLWLALVPVLASQVAGAGLTRPMGTALRVGGRVTAAVLAALYLGLLQSLSFGVPGLRPARNIVLLPVGWPQMGQELEREQADAQRKTRERVLIVGMDRDFIASEAAFYHSRRPQSVREVTGAHLFGEESLMYAYWFPPSSLDGTSLVLASFNSHWINTEEVARHCDTMEEIQSHAIQVRGRTVCNYYTRMVHGYHSVPASREAVVQ